MPSSVPIRRIPPCVAPLPELGLEELLQAAPSTATATPITRRPKVLTVLVIGPPLPRVNPTCCYVRDSGHRDTQPRSAGPALPDRGEARSRAHGASATIRAECHNEPQESNEPGQPAQQAHNSSSGRTQTAGDAEGAAAAVLAQVCCAAAGDTGGVRLVDAETAQWNATAAAT